MQRSSSFIAACLLALVFFAPGHAQDSPSLGDLARQAQKNKTSASAKKVLTNDDISSGSSSGSGLASSGLGSLAAPAAPAASGNPSAGPTPEQAVGQMESLLNQLDSMDRAALVKYALQGNDTRFSGRASWEQKLFAAKQLYVARGRELLLEVKQIQIDAESLKGVQDPNDPRVKNLAAKFQSLVRDGTRMDAEFQALILEGRDLAGQTQTH